MNREIKFRFHNEKGITEFEFKEMCFKGIWDLFPNLKNFNPDYIQQYIGIKDKNGRDIYEGDILRLEQFNPQIYQVIFERGAFCFVDVKNSEKDYPKDCKYLEDGEIIGNIYENPNLIK